MKRLFLLVAVALMTCTFALAQTADNTVTNSQNKNLGYTKTSIFLQYGYMPVTSMDFWSFGVFPNYHHVASSPIIDNGTISSFGAATVGASFDLSKLIELSIPFTYTRSTGTYKYTEGLGNFSQDYTDNWYVMTPNVKFNWYHSNNGKLMLYSRVGLGLGLGTRKTVDDEGVHLNTKAVFSFIASPIGMEYGKNISFFLEGGFGYTGIVSAGVRFRFKKTSRGFNADGTAKDYNWTDRYKDMK